MQKILKIHPTDNVAVALTDLPSGCTVPFDGDTILVKDKIQAKHKIALAHISKGDPIFMYGVLVGKAKLAIEKGGALTTFNVAHESTKVLQKLDTMNWTPPDVSKWKDRTFLGYHRSNGQVGTMNVWIFIPLVFCENNNILLLKETFEKELGYRKPNEYQSYLSGLVNSEVSQKAISTTHEKHFKNIDGIKFLTHEGGCGGIRQDAELLCKLIVGYLRNPNVAGATVLSLGCQNAQVNLLQKALKEAAPDFDKPLLIFEQQKFGTESALIKEVIRETFDSLKKVNETTRKPAPLSKLKIGLKCGGSDGFSGISANPTLGHVSDVLSALGGSLILCEFPELCGVEQELVNRCVSNPLAEKFLDLMHRFEKSVINVGSGFDMNPSPGNIKDGLITDAMKSAGAAKKGGTSPIHDVLDYAEYVSKPGLTLLCTPGNDVESTTGMAGSGASLILFTTGLGTPTGNPIAPVIKVSSNHKLAEKMHDIIDFDAGAIIEGTSTIEQTGDQLLDLIIEVASGKVATKSWAMLQNDFIPWKRGVSL
jgi:altronate hydrolase